jgi:RecA/RadA recombinase
MNFIKTPIDIFNLFTKGIPEGNFTVITGLEGTGKTTFMLQIINSISDGKCIFYNTEKTLLEDRIAQLVKNPDKLQLIDDIFTYEDLWENIEKTVMENEKSKNPEKLYLFWDSIAQTTFRAEEKGEVGDAEMAMRARLLSAIFRKYLGIFKKLNVTLIATNQLRFKIGATPFEDPYIMPGGKAPYYAAFLYIYLKRQGFFKFVETKHSAVVVQCQIKKNNAFWSPVEFPMVLTPQGFDNSLSTFQYCIEQDYIEHSGGPNYAFKELGLKFKRAEWGEFYENHRDKILNFLQEKILKDYGLY